MRLGALIVLASSTAYAAPPTTLVAEVDYNFIDQNGFGWASTVGKVTVTLTFSAKDPSLTIRGKRSWNDAQLVAGKTPKSAPDVKSNKWEGDVDETYPLHDVTTVQGTISFKVDPIHDKLVGICAPTKVAKIASTTLWECSITGFKWHTIANLPELHHPIILDSDEKAKLPISNSMSGAAKPMFGQRTVTAKKPVAAPKLKAKP